MPFVVHLGIFSILFIWKIDKRITLTLLLGYIIIFLVTNILLKFLYQMKERILDNEEGLNRFLVRGFMEMVASAPFSIRCTSFPVPSF